MIETAPVSVSCCDIFYKLGALFDKGSIRTYIIEDLGNVFKVKPVEQQTCSVYLLFESNKAKENA